MKFNHSINGFVFTGEVFLSIFLFCLIVFSFQQSFSMPSIQELYLLQKANDLLKVWSIERNFSEQELFSDINFVFPNNCVILKINAIEKNSCIKTSRFFSTSAILFDDFLKEFELRLVVYY